MKDKIQALLERELDKLDKLSKVETDGLDINSVRRLDMLIKCYQSFIGKPELTKQDPTESPQTQTTEELLKAITKG
jgi:hypothetical protein